MSGIKNLPENVLLIKLSGKVTKKDVKAYENDVYSKLKDFKKIGLLIDISELSDMTGDAIAEDIKFELGLLSKLTCFSKVAIVSDKEFVKATLKFFEFFVPFMDMKIFNTENFDSAVAFVSDLSKEKVLPKSDIKFLKTESADLFAYEINGVVTKEMVEKIIPKMQDVFENHDKIDLLVKVQNYSGVSPEVLVMPSLYAFKMEAINHVRRYAVIGAKGWMKQLVGIFKPFVPMEVKTFDLEDEAKAWEWLNNK